MDPGLFSFLFAHTAQQQQVIQAARLRAQQAEEEQKRQAVLMQHRRELVAAIRDETGELARASGDKPMQAYVHLQIMLNHLERAHAVPEAFEDETEKEEVILLWRQLLNLVGKCQAGMLGEQQEQCQKCVQAIAMKNFIQYTAEQLGPYQEFLRVKSRWEAAHTLEKSISNQKKIAFAVIAALALVTFIPFALSRGLEFAGGFLLLWVLGGLTAALAVHVQLDQRKPKNLEPLDREYRQAYLAAGANDETYWKAVRDTFDGVPTPEQLEHARAEQEPIIRAIFGAESVEPQEPSAETPANATMEKTHDP